MARTPPELARNIDGVRHAAFIAHPVHQPMMDSAERNREFIAGLATQGTPLHEQKMMRVGRLTTEQAGLLSNVTKCAL